MKFLPIRSRTVIVFLTLALIFLAIGASAEKHPPSKPIDLNVANVKELQELPGVGPVTAQRIIDMRQKSGHFKRVEDLLAVRGISPKKLDAMRPYVSVTVPPPSVPPAQKSGPPAKK
jgi:competence ComEA-like helix-hairpin-helix protein